MKIEKHFLLSLFFFALLIRLIYVIPLNPGKLSLDSAEWSQLARDVIEKKHYGDEYTWRPPGYVLFLAATYVSFGKSVVIVRIIQTVLGSLTCLIIYLIGKKIFCDLVGKIASVLLSLYPYAIAYAGDILSETFYTFLISITLLSIIIAVEQPSAKNQMFIGVLFGLTALTKATILPFYFIACFWIWWRTKKIKNAFLAGIFTLLTICPWTIRNYLHYHKFILISFGYGTLWTSNNDETMILETIGEKEQPAASDWDWTPKRYKELIKLPRIEAEKIFEKEAKEWIKNNPEKFRWLLKKRLIHFWRLYPMMAYKWQKIAAMITSGIYIPLCFIGIILSIKNFKNTSLLIFLFIVYTLVHLPFAVLIRYRVPVDPYIIIFASYTIHFIWIKLKSFISSRV
ncbi:MAG: glycosyltransferase family 39 protein [Elusimicrobia bacterium]|nr:glycosyltransferase family 39 protein [Elusimicrobiota bacterium]